MATKRTSSLAPFRSEAEERAYWEAEDRREARTARRKGQRPGWQASTLYLADADDRALTRFCKMTGEKMAPVIRRAIHEYLIREARKLGMTYRELIAEEKPAVHAPKRRRAAA
jgi:hypothetical protein